MIKRKLEEAQPVAYQTLLNALQHKKLAHAYLFVGAKGTPKKETALLVAQSLMCENTENGWACEVCDCCRRIAEGSYTDVVVLDGSEKSIKKESILNLQEQFSKTALEQGGKKVYILDYAENATTEALNSLLKFLEEPNGQDTFAVLTIESVDRLLPTIVSRCQLIPFKPMEAQRYYEMAMDEGLDELDSYLLSYLVKDVSLMKSVQEMEEYQMALVAMQQFVKEFPNALDRFLVWYQKEMLGDKEKEKTVFKFFLDLLILFFRDVVANQFDKQGWYYKHVMQLKEKTFPYDRLMLILLESKDKCNRPYHLSLLVEQTLYQIKEVLK